MADSKNMEFLRRVKAGEYAKIEESSLKYVRMEERTITVGTRKIKYHYSMR